MKIPLIFTCVTLALAAPSKDTSQHSQTHTIEKKQVDQIGDGLEFEYISQDPGLSADYGDSNVAATHQRKPKTGYSAGGGLVSIAQGAADAAHNSVVNQPSAGHQAAYTAKNTLAQSAAQSAATAAAALAGKQIIFMGLEQQSYNAHQALNGEKAQLLQAQRAATAARNSAQQAMHQVQVIQTAMNAAQATAEHAAQAASEAAAELAAQTSMVGAAKAQVHAIDEQLEAARVDFEATQAAAQKAAALAQKAQNNAAAAAAHAAQAASEAASHSIGIKHDHEALQSSIRNSGKVHNLSNLLREPSSHHKHQKTVIHDQGPSTEEQYSTNSYDSPSPYTTSAITSQSYSAQTPLDYDYKSSSRVIDYPGY